MDDFHLRLRLVSCQLRWMDWAAMLFAEVSRFLPLFLSTVVARSTVVAGPRAGRFILFAVGSLAYAKATGVAACTRS